MAVGDSVFVPSALKAIQVLRVHVASITAVKGYRYSVRKTAENGIPGARVWRIE